jgi:hypothetical protein
MKLHRYIDHDWQVIPINSQITRSKVKVTVTRNSIMVSSRIIRPSFMKLHRYIDHNSQMTPIDFQVTRSKVKVMVTQTSKMVSR